MHIFSHYLCLLNVHQHETRAMVQQCLAAPAGRMWSCQGNIKSTAQHPNNHSLILRLCCSMHCITIFFTIIIIIIMRAASHS